MRSNIKWEQDGSLSFKGCDDAAHNSWASGFLRFFRCLQAALSRLVTPMHETRRRRRIDLTRPSSPTPLFVLTPSVPPSE